MIQLPLLRPRAGSGRRVFGVSLLELNEGGLVKNGIPLVVCSLVEFLREHGLQQEGLFRVNGNVRAVEGLRQRYESGEEVDLLQDGDVCTVASLLKQFLRDLPEGVITSTVQLALLQQYQECCEDQFSKHLKDLLQQLPEVNYSLLKYLCYFLTEVEKQHQDNQMTALNLATVFGPSFFHVSPGLDGMKEQNICNKITAKLIQNYCRIFKGDGIPGEPQEEVSKVIAVKVKVRSDSVLRVIPPPSQSNSLPHVRLLAPNNNPKPNDIALSKDDITTGETTGSIMSSHEDERPVSPFYLSVPLLSAHRKANSANFLQRTVRLAVEQHLFATQTCGDQSSDVCGGQSSQEYKFTSLGFLPELDQHRRPQWEWREGTNKENMPSAAGQGWEEERVQGGRSQQAKHRDDQRSSADCFDDSREQNNRASTDMMEIDQDERRDDLKENDSALLPQSSAMKIQGIASSGNDPGRAQKHADEDSCKEVPRLDLSALTEKGSWEDDFFTVPFLDFKSICQQSYDEDPMPAYSSWQRESMDRKEARLSPFAEGRLIRQLLEEDSDPMLSPRLDANGHSQQYLDDPEVPPSPPNTYSFLSRRRSSSLGSCEDDREELTSAQLSKKIHSLKKKISRFEEKFEEERKYRPSHSDKAANPEVLRWMNELSNLCKELKEYKLKKPEDDLPPLPHQRSNTLPKSFSSQLEKRAQEKVATPPVETTQEAVQKRLHEKRKEEGRPEDLKDMTREQIAAEKLALQKTLLHYEGIHGRPVTKNERQIMKPLYDRYRLVKQILCRASTIPVIEEEDGSEDDMETHIPVTMTIKPELRMLGFLDHLEQETDGFISPIDELSPSKNSTDMRLSNLHSATMQELVEQLQKAREDKKRIRKSLKEFEDEFFQKNRRNVQKEDRSPLGEKYNEYKHIKAKLKLLHVLISKRDSSKFI
ncbi:hypothetical protein MATL_G00226830 [Megalops atlanticus]|uniref:Rho-GAP domain-containing protein n=1 Tax=Megalops atlanticus TaxID=7932 RepID=A0A9D3PJ87_MEGAT|nr:hypothetical protein MATL_G00226830 [Megalops atlanticus]